MKNKKYGHYPIQYKDALHDIQKTKKKKKKKKKKKEKDDNDDDVTYMG